jgi:hypothetical protein
MGPLWPAKRSASDVKMGGGRQRRLSIERLEDRRLLCDAGLVLYQPTPIPGSVLAGKVDTLIIAQNRSDSAELVVDPVGNVPAGTTFSLSYNSNIEQFVDSTGAPVRSGAVLKWPAPGKPTFMMKAVHPGSDTITLDYTPGGNNPAHQHSAAVQVDQLQLDRRVDKPNAKYAPVGGDPVVAGQQMNLIADLRNSPNAPVVVTPVNAGIGANGNTWVIPGAGPNNFAVAGYNSENIAGAAVAPLQNTAGTDAISYYWIAPSLAGKPYTVTYSFSAFGNQYEASANFVVTVPQATMTGTMNPTVGVVNAPGSIVPTFMLGKLPKIGQPGITITAKATTDQFQAGQLRVVQQINRDTRLTPQANGPTQVLSTGGAVLDNPVRLTPTPQGNVIRPTGPTVVGFDMHASNMPPNALINSTGVGANSQVTCTAVDSPGALATVAYLLTSANEAFTDSFMYKPDGTNSIWVTLQIMIWDWSAVAVISNTGVSTYPYQYVSPNQNGVPSSILPVWSNNYSNVQAAGFVPATTAAISGVVRWGNQWPIANAKVVVAWNGGSASTTTGPTGMYVITNVPFGSTVTVSAADGTTGAAIGTPFQYIVGNRDLANADFEKTTN